MHYKNIKVLCVIKDDEILTRVVKQDPINSIHFQQYEFWGPLKISSVNTPELRICENVLFLRGDQRHANHRVDKKHYYKADIDKIKSVIQQANRYYHENISIQNPNG